MLSWGLFDIKKGGVSAATLSPGVGRDFGETPVFTWSYLNALALDQLEESNQRVLVHGQP